MSLAIIAFKSIVEQYIKIWGWITVKEVAVSIEKS